MDWGRGVAVTCWTARGKGAWRAGVRATQTLGRGLEARCGRGRRARASFGPNGPLRSKGTGQGLGARKEKKTGQGGRLREKESEQAGPDEEIEPKIQHE
jgi:hypothetical protein